MCGITSFLAIRATENHPPTQHEKLSEEIDKSLDIVKHRGPDASGKWISPDSRIGLGHVRLSIVDLTADGNQPFHDTANQVYAVVNGELYDHERYRAELAAEYAFQGHSDCEIVLALYNHYGLSFLSHLRGEFALVLWDAKRELFLATRDRYGVKSLYYTVVGDRLLVATEMKQFLAYGWEPRWCVRSVCEQGWLFDSRTFFRGVHKILPGHYLVSRNYGDVQIEKYWDISYPDKFTKDLRSEEEICKEVRERLLDAVRVRLRADVPVGIYLSGGIDSSAIAGMVVHLVKEGAKLGDDATRDLSRIQCFTVQFDKDSGADESDVARRTAEFLGVEFNPVHVTEEVLAEKLEDTVWYSESLVADLNGPGKLALAEATHEKGFKVVITGEGSDEHFAGYAHFQAEMLREDDHSWQLPDSNPSKAETALQTALARGIAGTPSQPASTSASTNRMLNGTRIGTLLSRVIPFFPGPWTAVYTAVDRPTILAESVDGQVRDAIARRWHPLHTSQYLWTKTAFANCLLRYLGDNVDMAHQVESRPAFLDHHLTEYVNGLPPALKMRYNSEEGSFCEKYILREAVKPFVTEEIYSRKKQAYVGPSRFAANGAIHAKLRSLVTRENVEQLGFVDWERTEPLLDRAFVDKDPLAFRAALTTAQFVILSQRFGVQRATPVGS